MDVARKLINQARMATVEGELNDKSGTMTGGNEKNKLHFSHKGESDLLVVKQTCRYFNLNRVANLQKTIKELKVAAQEDQEKYKRSTYHTYTKTIGIRKSVVNN